MSKPKKNAPAAPTKPVAPGHERPRTGGSFVRQPDGTLEQVEGPALVSAEPSAEPEAASPIPGDADGATVMTPPADPADGDKPESEQEA